MEIPFVSVVGARKRKVPSGDRQELTMGAQATRGASCCASVSTSGIWDSRGSRSDAHSLFPFNQVEKYPRPSLSPGMNVRGIEKSTFNK